MIIVSDLLKVVVIECFFLPSAVLPLTVRVTLVLSMTDTQADADENEET